jgi:hypothetical protein
VWVVWKNGPFPCGSFPDIKIARRDLVPSLLPGEKYVADRGDRDGRVYADTPTGYNNPSKRMKSIVRARDETFNSRLKKSKVLSTTYSSERDTRYLVFHAIANILQVEIVLGYNLYSVYYDDRLVSEANT